MKILVINGPNLNKLGERDKSHYGTLSLKTIEELLNKEFPQLSFVFYQSNIEGEIINKIQNASNEFNGIIINPGGYAHTSVSIRDALTDTNLPKIEVHLSHLACREEFRQTLVTASACNGYVSGFKENSYIAGAFLLTKILSEKES